MYIQRNKVKSGKGKEYTSVVLCEKYRITQGFQTDQFYRIKKKQRHHFSVAALLKVTVVRQKGGYTFKSIIK